MRLVIELGRVLTCASVVAASSGCWGPSEAEREPAAEASLTNEAPAGAEDEAPAEVPTRTSVPVQILPGPCVQESGLAPVGVAATPSVECLDIGSPLAGRTDVLDVQGEGEELRCVHRRDRTLVCTGTRKEYPDNYDELLEQGDWSKLPEPKTLEWTRELPEIDLFELRGGTLCVVGASGARCFEMFGDESETVSEHPRLAKSVTLATNLGTPCGITADQRLVCSAPVDSDAHIAREGVAALVGGGDFNCSLDLQGAVWCWGQSHSGELGDGIYSGPSKRDDPHSVEQPRRVDGLPPVVELVAGSRHVCARTGSGEVWCWGRDNVGQLGRGLRTWEAATPAPVWGLKGARALRAFEMGTCALIDGARGIDALRCWGRVGSIDSATPTNGRASVPARVSLPAPGSCVDVDLSSWRERVATSSGIELAEQLARLRILAGDGDEPFYSEPRASGIEIHEAELDGSAPSERVVVAWFHGHDYVVHAAVRVLSESEGRWCLPLASELRFSDGLDQLRACAPHPSEPPFEGPLRIELVELLRAGTMAIELRTQEHDCYCCLSHSHYETSYLGFDASGLHGVLEPFTTYRREHSELERGSIRLRGGFPRKIQTLSELECEYGYEDEGEDFQRCAPGRTRKTWIYDVAERRYR